MSNFYNRGLWGNSSSFVGSNWNFLIDYIKNVYAYQESFSSKQQVIKKLSPKSVWQTYMKWTVAMWPHNKIPFKNGHVREYTAYSRFWQNKISLLFSTRFRGQERIVCSNKTFFWWHYRIKCHPLGENYMYFTPKSNIVYGNIIRNDIAFVETSPMTSKSRPKQERNFIKLKRSKARLCTWKSLECLDSLPLAADLYINIQEN